MKSYFKLQYRMTNRRFEDAGIHPGLAYFLLVILFLGISIYLFEKTEFAEYFYLLSALIIMGNLSETRRTEFLKICFGNEKLKELRLLENITCAVPFLIFLVYKQCFISATLLAILTIILALVNFRTSLNYTMWTPFSKRPFEFTVGFRNTFYLFFIAYALAAIAVSVNNFNLGVFSMLFVFAITLSFYSNPEKEYFVWIHNVNATKFLLSKISTAVLFSAVLAMPVAILLGIFYYHKIGIILLFFFTGWAFLTCVIVGKYAAYPDEMNLIQGIFLALSLWFPPLLILLIPFLFIKSKNRLRYLLK